MNNNQNLPTKISLSIRILVSAYILYLAYGLITSDEPRAWYIWIFIVIFVGAGVLLISLSTYALAKGAYQGGKLDTSSDEDEINEEAAANTENEEVIIEEIKDAEIIESSESDIRLMGMYQGSEIETASEKDIENLD